MLHSSRLAPQCHYAVRKGDGMTADLIVANGPIYTMRPEQPAVDAVGIRDGRIVALGDIRTVRREVGACEVLDLRGRTAIPAFSDAHLHLVSYGLSLQQVDLSGARSERACAERVRLAAAGLPEGEWVVGRGWDRNLWAPPSFPRRESLDAVAPAHPVALGSRDGHALWVNSCALRRAGISATTPDPEGGRILRDPRTDEPTGILLEEAVGLVYEHARRPGPQATRRAILAAVAGAHRLGLTSVHDCEGSEAMAGFLELWREGGLQLRVYMLIPREGLDAAIALGLRTGFGDDWLRLGHLKLFADGALGSRTADMLEPYSDEPGNCGVQVLSSERLGEIVERASRAHIAVATHAIGDRANRRVLDAYAASRPVWYAAGLRPRIEHVQLLAPDDVGRLAGLGVVASMQPIHATSDMDMAEAHWGERSRGAYAWRSLLEAGTVLAFGSDCPVEALDPLAGIHAAVTRQRRDGTPAGGWRPEERLSVYEAVRAYTWGAAYAEGTEERKGCLAPGKVGDLVVLSEDIFRASPKGILDVHVVYTICGGSLVYAAG